MASDPAPPLRLSRRRQAAFLAAPQALFLLVLLAIEGVTRVALPHLSSLELFVTAPEQQAQFADQRGVRVFEGDPLLFWRLMPDLREAAWDLTLVTTNAQGLRYAEPVGPKPPGTFRIVALGDSVTFGYRVPRVLPRRPNDYDRRWLPYPRLLEDRLRAANPGRAIQVLPLAVPGYTSHQGLAWLRRDIAWLQPDLVTVCFGWNDIGMRAQADHQAMKMSTVHVAARRIVASSQALSHLWRLTRGLRRGGSRPGAAAVMRVPRDRYVANLLEIVRLAGARGARVAVIGPVYRDPVAHPPEGYLIGGHRGALRAALEAEGTPYLEIPELTEAAHPGNAHLFEEHIHPNHKGHRLIADRLGACLGTRGLLDGLVPPARPSGELEPAPR